MQLCATGTKKGAPMKSRYRNVAITWFTCAAFFLDSVPVMAAPTTGQEAFSNVAAPLRGQAQNGRSRCRARGERNPDGKQAFWEARSGT